MFSSVLIANRGEIACRIVRTAKRLGLRTIAVYSEADAKALHVRLADEAHPIGPPPAADSYLRIDKLIAVARAAGADCVHPGYGFLAENAEFAQSCRDARVVFIGPSPQAIRALGLKDRAKALIRSLGVANGLLDQRGDFVREQLHERVLCACRTRYRAAGPRPAPRPGATPAPPRPPAPGGSRARRDSGRSPTGSAA